MSKHWITDWTLLDDQKKYIVCPINARDDKTLYLGQPTTMSGWAARRIKEGCYAALENPPFPACPICGGDMPCRCNEDVL